MSRCGRGSRYQFKDARGSSRSPWREERRLLQSVSSDNECLMANEWETETDGDDIVIREEPAEDVSRYCGYAEEVQDEEHDGVRGLIRMR